MAGSVAAPLTELNISNPIRLHRIAFPFVVY